MSETPAYWIWFALWGLGLGVAPWAASHYVTDVLFGFICGVLAMMSLVFARQNYKTCRAEDTEKLI